MSNKSAPYGGRVFKSGDKTAASLRGVCKASTRSSPSVFLHRAFNERGNECVENSSRPDRLQMNADGFFKLNIFVRPGLTEEIDYGPFHSQLP